MIECSFDFDLKILEFRSSRLTRLLYSQNIQRGPPLGA